MTLDINLARDNPKNSALSVGTTPTLLSPVLPLGARKSLVITNTSTGGQIIYLAWGEVAQVGRGIALYPSGTWCESIDNAYIPSTQEIWTVSSAAGGTLAIQERLIGGM